MKRWIVCVPVALAVFTVAFLGLSNSPKAYAAGPSTINFQGKVVNADGTNVSNGTYSFIFRLYNTASPTTTTACASDATCLFEETQSSVTVTNGVFQVELGSTCTGGLVAANSCDKSTAINFSTSNALYLTLKFNGDSAGFMSPTMHFTSVPYAYNADNLGGIGASGFIQNTTSTQTANFNVQSASISSVAAVIQGASGQTADLLDIKNSTTVLSIGNNGQTLFKPTSGNNSTTFLQVQPASSTTPVLDVDTTNSRVGIGTASPSGTLEVASGQLVIPAGSKTAPSLALQGSLNTGLYFGSDYAVFTHAGTPKFFFEDMSQRGFVLASNIALSWVSTTDATSVAPDTFISRSGTSTITVSSDQSTGSADLIVNGHIGIGNSSPGTTRLAVSNLATGDSLVNLQDNTTSVLTIDASGLATFSPQSSSSSAFVVRNSSSKNLLAVDTSGSQVVLGTAGSSGINGKLVFNTTNASNTTISITAASTGTSYSLTLPTTGPTTSQCLQTDPSTASQLLFGSCAGAGGGVTSVGTYSSSNHYTNGASISGTTITLGSADATHPGLVDTGAQTFAGNKTLTGNTTLTGTVLAENSSNSAAAFQIQNASGVNLLVANTSGNGSAPTSPGVAAGANSGGSLSGSSSDTYYYEVSAILPGGIESPASSEVSINGSSFTPLSPPSAPSAADAGAGSITCSGSGCRWLVTFVTANGETTAGTASAAQTTTGHQWNVTIPTGPAGTTVRRLYRNNNGGAYQIVNAVGDNTTTVLNDNDGGTGGTPPPGTNTATTNTNNASISWTAVAGATSYRIYSGTAPGAETDYGTSTSSPFTDTGAFINGGAPTSASVANVIGINSSQAIFNPASDSTSAFQIQDSSGSPILTADSINQRIAVDATFSAMSPPPSPAAAVETQAATPTVTPSGATGSITYSFVIIANTPTGPSAASAAGTTSSGYSYSSLTCFGFPQIYTAVSWSAYPGATSYSVYRTVGGDTQGLVNTTTSTSYNDYGTTNVCTPTSVGDGSSPTGFGSLSASSTYKYEITAVDATGGETAASSEVTATTGSTIKTINVSWSSVTGAIDYKIYRTAAGGGTGTETYLGTTGATYFVDNGSLAGTSAAPPSSNTAYYATANTSNSHQQLSVGGNGTTTGQVYISGTQPVLVGQSNDSVLGGGGFETAIQGRYLYVLDDTNNKLDVYDVSNPANPTYIGQNSDSNLNFPVAISISGHYAVITNDSANKLVIYDISNPSTPVYVGENSDSNLTGPTYLAVQGHYAYMTTGSSAHFFVCDFANPVSFTCNLYTNAATNPSGGVTIQGNYLYILYGNDHAIFIYNISNPNDPVYTGKASDPSVTYPLAMFVQGRYAYVGTAYSGVDGLVVFDISNPSAPTLVGSNQTADFSIDEVQVQGRYAYASGFNNASGQTLLLVYDISNPANPVLISTSNDSANPYNFSLAGRYAYALNNTGTKVLSYDLGGTYSQQLEAGGLETGTLAVDSNSTFAGDVNIQGGTSIGGGLNVQGNTALSGQLNVQGLAPTFAAVNSDGNLSAPIDAYVQGKYAYVVNDTSPGNLLIYDVSNPNSPTFVGENSDTNLNDPQTVVVEGKYAYITSYGNGKLTVYDISNPSSPTYVGENSDSNIPGARGLYVQGRYAYVTSSFSVLNYLSVYDISNPSLPIFLGHNTDSNLSDPWNVYVQGHDAYVTSPGTSKLAVYDVSTPSSPTFVAVNSDSNLSGPTGLDVQGRYAYVVSNGNNKLAIYDISNPSSPTYVASNGDSNLNNPASVVIQGQYAYLVNTGNNNIAVYDISNPTTPSFVAVNTDNTLDDPLSIFVQGRYAYVTNGFSNKLAVYNISGAYLQQVEAGGLETGTLQVDSNGQVAGDFNVQGGLSVGQSLNVNGNIGASGDVLIDSVANSATAFQVQNATGVALLTTDANGSQVDIGSPTTDATAILLHLDDYNQATDPSGSDGEMYYNTNLGKFRCHENGAWTNCIGSGSGTASEYGDGSDGTVTFNGSSTILGMAPSSSVYTMTRDIYCVSITINNGVTLKTAGFRIFATGTLTVNTGGIISNVGGAGGNATAGAVGAAGATSTAGFYLGNNAGGAGGSAAVGSVGTAAATSGSFGGVGGSGGTNTNAGGAGGTLSAPAANIGGTSAIKSYTVAVLGALHNNNATTMTAGIQGGTGGGGGGSSSTANRGGGGGGGGGVIFIAAAVVSNSGTISANGGNGGNGNASGGVGGGGGGGVVMVFSGSYTGSAPTAAGGTKGTTGTTTSANNGNAGIVLQEDL